MNRVLIVEDERDLASLLEFNLKAQGFEPTIAYSGATALTLLRDKPFDLVLLDVMLPDVMGTEVLQLARADPRLSALRIMLVTARGQEADRIAGLELGADDYVVKPFSVKELLLRVKAVLRRGTPAGELSGPALEHAGIRLDPSSHEVTVRGKSADLTALEFRLLKTLMERVGRVQSREVLLADVWDIHVDINTRTVDTHIKRLREKLGEGGGAVETVRGVGYKLLG